MGAWGLGSFENDDALDWVAEFEGGGAGAVRTSLNAACDDSEELDAPEASEALAAAEIVAAAKTGDPSRVAEDARAALSKYGSDVATQDMVVLAKEAVQRIKSKSELRELWQESDEFDAWVKDVEALEARLA